MRNRRAIIAVIAAALVGLGAREARAAGMDPTPERFVLQPPGLPPGQTCQSIAADPGAAVSAGLRPQDFPCRPNNLAFRNFISELGFAMAPNAFHPARTTGMGGFVVSLDASYTRIYSSRSTSDPDGSRTHYWRAGTRGDDGAPENASPDSLLQIYSLKARKGLPLGFEIAGSFGYVANTSLWIGGADLRWSILEGFRTGVLGVLPDVSIGGGVRSLTGTSRFYLTTVGIDVKISKPVTLADSAVLIPSIGYQRLIIFGDSNVVDATPNVDALAQCGSQGNDPSTGAPVCANKLPNGAPANTDLSNNMTFDKVRIHRNRGLVGLNYRYELVWLGSQLAFDLTDPKDENPGLVGGLQWTLSFEAGVSF